MFDNVMANINQINAYWKGASDLLVDLTSVSFLLAHDMSCNVNANYAHSALEAIDFDVKNVLSG